RSSACLITLYDRVDQAVPWTRHGRSPMSDLPPPPPTDPNADLPRTIDGPLVVVGDLHGASHLLDRLWRRLTAGVRDLDDRWVAFAGDFPDRGPDTRGVLDAVIGLRGRHGRVAAVMGNHDLALAGALGLVPAPPAANWGLRYVADYDAWPTFASYG